MSDWLGSAVSWFVRLVIHIAEVLSDPLAYRTEATLLVAIAVVLVAILGITVMLFLPKRKTVLRAVEPVTDTPHEEPGSADGDSDEPEDAVEARVWDEDDVADQAETGEGEGWVGARRLPVWALWTVALVLLFAALVSTWVVTGTQAFCADACHGELAATTGDDAHSSARCIDCHGGGLLKFGTDRVRWVAGGIGMTDPRQGAAVSSDRCERCHDDIRGGTVTVAGIHMSHAEVLEAGLRCVECHRRMAPHTSDPITTSSLMAVCIRCHDGQDAPAECDMCHVGDPGESTTENRPFPTATINLDRDCGGCHSQTSCDECHGLRMPHSRTFIDGGHARVGAFDEGKALCTRCHVPSDCSTQCHEIPWGAHVEGWKQMHKGAPSSSPCACHAQRGGRSGEEPFCPLCHAESGVLLEPLPR